MAAPMPDFDPANHLLVVADDITRFAQLRRVPCHRLLPAGLAAMANYIRQHRPDLSDAGSEAFADIAGEK